MKIANIPVSFSLDSFMKIKHEIPFDDEPSTMTRHEIFSAQSLFSQYFHMDNDEFPTNPPAPSATPVKNLEDNTNSSPTSSQSSSNQTLLSCMSSNHTELLETNYEKIKLEVLKSVEQKSNNFENEDGASLNSNEEVATAFQLSLPSSSVFDEDSIGQDNKFQVQNNRNGVMGIGRGENGQFSGVMLADSSPATSLAFQNSNYNMNFSVSSSNNGNSSSSSNSSSNANNNNNNNNLNKNWSRKDMDSALVALRTHKMNLTKASSTYGIPPTTLWVHAHRKGIDTPKKDPASPSSSSSSSTSSPSSSKSYNEDNLNLALEALRSGQFSANKASKTFGIPSSTLYKIAKREGIRLMTPFNATPTNWTSEDLEKALEAIRTGQATVQKASVEFGIPAGTLYGRCKREGIELSRSGVPPWSEEAMVEALEAVKVGTMSINQAAINYNLPYSSLYGRVKRLKLDHDPNESTDFDLKNIETQYLNLQNQSDLSN